MNFEEANKILPDEIKEENGGLFSIDINLNWSPGDQLITLDGTFSAEFLEAIACWTREKMTKKEDKE
jgi:hypothetical protein